MNEILINIWGLFLIVYTIRVYLGYQIITNENSSFSQESASVRFRTLLYPLTINLKKIDKNLKVYLFGRIYNTLTFVIYGLLVMHLIILLSEDLSKY